MLIGILTLAGPRILLVVTVFLATTTLPAAVPNAIQVGPLAVNLYEPLLFALALRMVASPRTNSRPTKNGLMLLGLLTIVPAIVGLIGGAVTRWIVFDVRGLVTLTAAAVVAAYVAVDRGLCDAAVRTLRTSLWISAAFTLAAAVGIVAVGGRTEDASLYLDGQASSSGATRLLTDATHVSLAVLCVALSALIMQRARLGNLLPYILPALLVTTFSFSRNALLALGVAAMISAVFAGRRGITGTVRATAGLTLVGVAIAGTAVLIGGQVMEFAHAQWQGYSDRVVSGLQSDVRGRDASTLQRLAENDATTSAIADAPVLGHGFGYAYRPAFGAPGTFAGEEGRFYSHNFYYWLGVKTGLLGLLVFMWSAMRPAVRGLRTSHSAVAVGTIAMLTVNVVAPLPLSTESSGSITMGALIGVCLALAPAPNHPRSTPSKSPRDVASA